MLVNAHRIALSAAAATGIVQTLSGLFTYFLPDQAMKIMASLYMIDVRIVDRIANVTFFNIAIGFLQTVIYTYIYVLLVCIIYNFISKKMRK